LNKRVKGIHWHWIIAVFWRKKIFGPAQLNGFRRIPFNEDLHGWDKDIDPLTYMSIKRLQLPGNVVRMFENRNQKVILEKNLGRGFPARNPGINGKIKCRRMRPCFSVPKDSMHRQGTGVIWERKQGRIKCMIFSNAKTYVS